MTCSSSRSLCTSSIAIFLLLPDLRRLADFFLLGRPAPAQDPASPAIPAALRALFKALLIGYALLSSGSYARTAMHRRGTDAPRPPLYGIYQVDELIRDGALVPPLATDRRRWGKVIVDVPDAFLIQQMDGSIDRYRLLDEGGNLTVTSSNESYRLTWERLDDSRAVVKGSFAGASLSVKLHRLDLPLLH
jgi:hypothetical protein